MMGLGGGGERARCVWIPSTANTATGAGAQGTSGMARRGRNPTVLAILCQAGELAQASLPTLNPTHPGKASLKHALSLGTQICHSLAQMPPRELTANSTDLWLYKLDFSLENTV